MDGLNMTAFQPDGRLPHSGWPHAPRRGFGEVREFEFTIAASELPARQVHGIAQFEGCNIDDEFARVLDVEKRMTEPAVDIAAVGTEHDCWRGVPDAVEETKRCKIRPAKLVHRADPADRSWHNARREWIERQAVVIL